MWYPGVSARIVSGEITPGRIMVSILKILSVYMYLEWKLKNTQEKVQPAKKLV